MNYFNRGNRGRGRQDNFDSCPKCDCEEFGELREFGGGFEPISKRRECECKCKCEPVDRQEFKCEKDQQVRKHQHIVKHQHDIIDEYDVVHEHVYNYFDVVKEREVVKKNNFCKHEPDYCKEEKERERECECVCECDKKHNRHW